MDEHLKWMVLNMNTPGMTQECRTQAIAEGVAELEKQRHPDEEFLVVKIIKVV